MSFKKKFWDEKILLWEKKRYDRIPKIFDTYSSLKCRLHLAYSVLSQISDGKRLLELGCGSGRLWEKINSLNLKSYTGVDFSETAIEAFQHKIQDFKSTDYISLFCEDCTQNIHSVDIVVSLGLFDWISVEQIEKIANSYKDSWYLHSFSEKCLSLPQVAHYFYSFLNYRCRDYSPVYRSANDLLSLFGPKAKIYRDPDLSFGAFIYRLPNNIRFKC